MNERTNKSPPVFYRTSSPSGSLPKKALMKVREARVWEELGEGERERIRVFKQKPGQRRM